MGKEHNRKLWACLLVIAMVTSTFVGFSTIVWGTSNSPGGLMKTIPDIDITEAMLSDNWILISFPNKVEGDPLTLIVDEVDEIGGGAGYVLWDVVLWFDPQSAPGSEW